MPADKEIVGTAVRNNAGNLSDDQQNQIFYDSTNVDFKYRIQNKTSTGAWRTQNNTNTAREKLAGAGLSTAALAIGGETPPGAVAAINESWDGTSWTELNDLNTARSELKAGGTYTSALAFGGRPPSNTAKQNPGTDRIGQR